MSETPLFVEIHLLRSHAPGNMNRDDLGTPKTARFGNVRRLRLSSQCLKRTWRTSPQFVGALARENLGLDVLGVRTKKLPKLIREALAKDDVEPAALDGIDQLLQQIGRAESTDGSTTETETAHLLFLARAEVDEVRKFARDARADLRKLAELTADANKAPEAPAADAEAPAPKAKGRAKKPKNEEAVKQREELIKSLRDRFKDHMAKQSPRNAVDVALFGRFVTSSEFGGPVNAAVQVAHAIGTEKVEVEYDYFSAVDDLGDSAAAGHLGETEFAASVLYQYAVCDFRGLGANLQGDTDLATKALAALATAAARAVPTGKKNGTAPQSPADFIEVVVRTDAPISLVNAFLKPVEPSRQHDVMEVSIERLRDFSQRYEAAYSDGGVAARLVLDLRAPAGSKVDGETRVASLGELAASLKTALARALTAPGGA